MRFITTDAGRPQGLISMPTCLALIVLLYGGKHLNMNYDSLKLEYMFSFLLVST